MSSPSIRIASYNIQKCVGLDLRRHPGRVLKVINALEADLVLLQEADKRLPPRPAALPHDMVEAAGWHILPFGAQGNSLGGSLGWHGNAMLVRHHLALGETRHIELPGLEPRGAILAELHTPIGPLRVIGAHLGLLRRYRLLQIAAIMRVLSQMPPCATVLGGDMNDWGSGAAIKATARDLCFVPTPPSFPAARPMACLDRFALSAPLVARSSGTFRARPARLASDHLPVWIDIARRER